MDGRYNDDSRGYRYGGLPIKFSTHKLLKPMHTLSTPNVQLHYSYPEAVEALAPSIPSSRASSRIARPASPACPIVHVVKPR